MKIRSLHEQWLEFAAMTLPPDAPEIQRQDTETAFKGGAISVLLEQHLWATLPDEEAMKVMAAWKLEAQAHFAKYRKAV